MRHGLTPGVLLGIAVTTNTNFRLAPSQCGGVVALALPGAAAHERTQPPRRVVLKPATIVSVYGHVSAVFKAAARDRIITRTPCEGITLPKADKDHEVVPLTVDQVTAAVAALPDRLSAAARVAAGTGLRQGEVLGLTLDRVDFLRRTVKVDRQMITPAKGEPGFGPPKTRASYRTVPLPESVAVVLSEHLRRFPARESDGLIFTNERGGPVRRTAIARVWKLAMTTAELPETGTFHALRHFYASALIQFGESVKVVQARLGHASAMETLDTYGHLWPDSEDGTRQAIDAVLGNPAGQARGAATG